ncbi:HD-GYP domain-containing protein [Halalkalibacter urbisdiaboli]|uniref:HD-GYP domain-containing protein n=1 Tax=Halalkalibacter urbisdiaboli TaxID=1960589 RepID=UPI000B4552B9|nr:HD domain-containing protein [Halalkalibacter urbisdiaboli]
MRMIEINEYDESSMQLAKPVCDSKRRVLLGSGSKLHPKYLEKLIQMGIKYVFVEDSSSKGISLDEMLDMPTWMDIITVVERSFNSVVTNKPLPIVDLQVAVKKLIEEIKKRDAIMLIPTTAVDSLLTPFAHTVNVTLIALQIGKKIGLTNSALNDLGIGCLLHDIGKSKTNVKEEHPEAGFNIIRSNRELSLMSAHIAYQHHERLDGTGYPRNLSENDIIEYAQICSIANDYDNFVSIEGVVPHEAIERIMTFSDTKYSHSLVAAFSQGIISYPPGTNVKLNIGTGIVTRVESNPHRPIVKLHKLLKEVDLNKQPTIVIESILKEKVV